MYSKLVVLLLLVTQLASWEMISQENPGTEQDQEMINEDIHIMPWPQQITSNSGDFEITPDFSVFIEGGIKESSRIFKATTSFIRHMTDKTGVFVEEGFANPKDINATSASVKIKFEQEAKVEMNMDESYSLSVDSDGIVIQAKTDVGAMHGLATLLQLIKVAQGSYVFSGVEITDAPRFVWRGLMLDVSRHFMPVEVVKRNLDAMSLVKRQCFSLASC